MKVFLLWSVTAYLTPAFATVGFQQVSVPDPPGKALSVAVWFPSHGKPVSASVGPFQQMVVPDGRIVASAIAFSADRRAAGIPNPIRLICWPSTARIAISNPSHPPGARRSGRCRTRVDSTGSAERCRSIVSMLASRSNSRRRRATIVGRDLTLGNKMMTSRLCCWRRCATAMLPTVGLNRPQVTAIFDNLDARNRPRAEESQHVVPVVRRTIA